VSTSVSYDLQAFPEAALSHSFSILARAEVSVLPRVLELFVKRGILPRRCLGVVGGADRDELEIDVRSTCRSTISTRTPPSTSSAA
jgi:hypothetical protein